MSHTTLQVQVKREPSSGAELVAGLLPGAVVKLEAGAKQHQDAPHAANLNNGSIPVGIAVARQRMPHELGTPLLLPTHKDQHHRIPDIGHTSPMCCHFISSDAASAAMTVGVAPAMGGALLHCEERATNQMTGWPVTSAHGVPPPPLAPPPTLWQYPAPMTMESMMVPPAPPAPPGGFQLVRDPTSGALLLIPAADQFQQAVVWGGAPVLLPPPPLQLLGGGELLASATLHQHTQTTRLVALDKRAAGKLSVPAHALIKLEPDAALLDACQPPHCTKALQTVSSVASNSAVFGTEPNVAPLLATHLFYQPSTNFVQISQSPSETAPCRSAGTSPAARLSPPPEPLPADEPPGVVDASNQTDSHPYEDDDLAATDESAPDEGKTYTPSHHRTMERDEGTMPPLDAAIILTESRLVPERNDSPSCANSTPVDASVQSQDDDPTCGDRLQHTVIVEKSVACETDIVTIAAACSVQRDLLTDNNSSSRSSNELIIDSASSDYARDESECDKIKSKSMTKVDLSGLELLSNSIEQFETRNTVLGTNQKVVAGSTPPFIDAGLPISQNLSIEIKNPQTLQLPPNVIIKTSPKSPPEMKASTTGLGRFEFPGNTECGEAVRRRDAPALGGLGLLCALAEQRFMEEVEDESRPAAPLAIKTEPGLARCGASIVKPNGDAGPRLKLKDAWKTKCKDMEYGSDFNYRFKMSFDDANSGKDSENVDSGIAKSSENIKIRIEKGSEGSHSDRVCESEGDMVKSYKIGGEKRRSLEKARNASLPTLDNEELMESLDDTYRRIAQNACKDSRPERAGLPTTVELVNAMELDMRIRLADLQRQCKEKQRELNKMTPKTTEETPRRGPGRPRKKSVAGEAAPMAGCDRPSADFSTAFGVPRKEDETSLGGDAMLTLSALCTDVPKRSFSPIADSNSSQSSVDRSSSSKKRKVGRPKKLPSTPGSPAATETIVAKKPKSKSSLVGYLLAAKSRLNMNAAKGGIIYSKTNPPRPFEDEVAPRKHGERKTVKVKTNKRAHSSNCYSSPASSLSEYKYPADEGEDRYASFLTSKVRPKLKAEAKVKEYSEEDDASGDWGSTQATLADGRSTSSSMESLREVRLKNKEKTDRIALKHNNLKASKDPSVSMDDAFATASDSDKEALQLKKRRKSVKSKERTATMPETGVATATTRCTLTEADLARDKLRVLTAMGGLFYAGTLSAVQAPDVYAVTLDGERGNRPHILSREETLRDTILEVCPTSAQQLPPGTRLCAYWSQQYRCLYPGTVAEPVETDSPTDDRYVSVEFDDGDSGRIAIEDIRWLQPDYPVVEYDPNPLLTLGKRRRQTSINSNDEKKPQIPPLNNLNSDRATPNTIKLIRETTGVHSSIDKQYSDSEDRHRERKKLKKHRKEKLKRLISKSGEENGDIGEYIKKKKKKHKCCGEHCKHRKHKKHHRKHRKRHHSSCKDHSSSSSDDHKNKSSTDYEIRSSRDDSNDEDNATLVTVSGNNDMKKVIKKKNLVKNAILDIDKLKVGESGCSVEIASSSDVPIVKSSLKMKKLKKDNLKDSGIGLEDEQNGKGAEFGSNKTVKIPKSKKRTVSTTSSSDGAAASKMAAFLPGTALWGWRGVGHRRPAVKGRARKLFYKAIQRGQEVINVGDAAVFLSTGRPDRPYIGQVVAMWEGRGASMAVRVRWYYHPDETVGAPGTLQYPGGLFESPHTDENDVQTISHKCEVLPLSEYKTRLGDEPQRYAAVYDNNDLYYLAGRYDPTHQLIKMQPDIPLAVEQ